MRIHRRLIALLPGRPSVPCLAAGFLALALLVAACVTRAPGSGALHRWWAGLGPVLPHDTFPADCKLCHVGDRWDTLVKDFTFDHEKRTGVPLRGAHARALCLHCHNDRGPVAVFQAKGCAGCHEDVHQGDLGSRCAECHHENTWQPVGMVERHLRTRFPLTGAHARVSCYQCHPGGRVGNSRPVDTDCLTCHVQDMLATTNPPHPGLGWVEDCDRCHITTRWEQAVVR